MTQKEKAKELIEKFYSKYNNVRKDKLYSKEQIRMALICVDEILKIPNADCGRMTPVIKADYVYWQEIRKEIKNYE